MAGEVGGVGGGLEHVAEDGVAHGAGVDARPVQGRARRHNAEFDRGEVLEGAAEGAEAGTHAGEEDDSGLAWRGHDR